MAIHPIASSCILHEIESSVVQSDIEFYLQCCLRDIVVVRGYSSWPSQGELKALADRAGNLFIFASTKLKITGNISSMSYYTLQPLQVLLLTNPVSKSLMHCTIKFSIVHFEEVQNDRFAGISVTSRPSLV